jgi:serine/threonine-protein kinase
VSTPAPGAGTPGLVSLKLLHSFADVAEQRSALAREAELQSLCSHAGVVRVLTAPPNPPLGSDRGRCIVRQYVSGFALGELIDAGAHGAQPLDVVFALGDALLEILSAVHDTGSADGRALGLFHRDVTPSNVLVSLDGEVFLTDFGLAHAPGAFGFLSDEEIPQGTPRYVTPEAARGEHPDGRSDLFQTALLLLEALGCGLRESVFSLEAIRGERLRSALPEVVGDRAGVFGAVLGEALDADPAGRFATAADMRAAWRAAWWSAPEAGPRDPSESGDPADARTVIIRGWLAAFPDLVQRERDRVSRAQRAEDEE